MKVILRYPKREVEVAGRRRVKELLKELDVLPETVLVIRGSELLTADTVVGGDDVVELRPVISGGAPERGRGPAVKCRKCGDTAALELRRHNAAFCTPHFLEFFRKQVREAIRQHRMFSPRRADPGRRVGRQGLARPLGRAHRGRLRHRRALPRPRDLRLLGGVERQVRGVRGGARPDAASSSGWRRRWARRSRSCRR